MISREEKRYLYWLGKSFWSGKGVVVEIGPWLGGSTVCLAMGMKESNHNSYKHLKVFDNFIWREFMQERAKLSISSGDSFESFFLKNLSNYRDIVKHYKRALPDEVIVNDCESAGIRFTKKDEVPILESSFNDPVDILFIDGAKSYSGMLHLLKTFHKNFVSQKTYFVCQDYKYHGTYWVPAIMTKLKKYLKPVHNILQGNTVTFQLISEIPLELLNSFESNISFMNTEKTLQEIEWAGRMLIKDGDSIGGKNVLLGKVKFLSHQNKVDLAVKEFKEIQNSWGIFTSTIQLERARKYLLNEKSCKISKPKIFKLTAPLNKIKNKFQS